MNVNFGLFPPVIVKKPEGHVGRWKSTEKTDRQAARDHVAGAGGSDAWARQQVGDAGGIGAAKSWP